MKHSTVIRSVKWLTSLGEAALAEVMDSGELVKLRAGRPIVRELEVGDSVYILLDGEATVTVSAGPAGPVELGRIGPGEAVGELSVLTRELRSATVTAVGDVEALRLDRLAFERLLRRWPRIAVHFTKEIGARLDDSDRALDTMLGGAQDPSATRRLSGITAAVVPSRNSFSRAWRELVVARRGDLPFLALAAFLGTLVAIRLIVFAVQALGGEIFGILRLAYTSGIALLVLGVAASFARFSPRSRKAIALAYGVGFALVFNELSVFLAFDTFYLDMTTRDPQLVFSVDALYRRSESAWAVVILLFVLIQMTYMRRFYRRTAFIVATRLRRMVSRE